MRHRTWIAILALGGLLDGRGAQAQTPPALPAVPPEALRQSIPPTPLAPIQPVYPADAARRGLSGDVVLVLAVDETGAVTGIEVETGLPGGLTESAVEAARAARFQPALDASGRPMKVRIRWMARFTLPPTGAGPSPSPPPVPENVEKLPAGTPGRLVASIRERGTGRRLENAFLYIEDVAEVLHVDERGHVERELAPGAYLVAVRAPGHMTDEVVERIRPGERLERTYFIERERLNQYETVVRARPARAETGIVSLAGEELRNVAGTMGDPFKVVLMLPGVTTPMSGLPFPVVRGESPAATGTFVDDIRVPFLYHVGFGPAVVHPRFLESLDLHVGSFTPEFGRYTGGIVQAHTTGIPEESQTQLDADLFRLSAFHSKPFKVAGKTGAVTVAARYATLALLVQGMDPNAVLSYWDYQLRGDLRIGPGALRLLVFGSQDAIGNEAHRAEDGRNVARNVLSVGFHRADLRYRAARPGVSAEVGAELGLDFTDADVTDSGSDDISVGTAGNGGGGSPLQLRELVFRPRLTLELQAGKKLRFRLGGDVLFQNMDNRFNDFQATTYFPQRALTEGAFVQAEWTPHPRVLVVPGVRVDHYDYRYADRRVSQTGVDPRLNAQWKLRPWVVLKGSAGIYHAPPRFLIPWPGLDGYGLEKGLTTAYQSSLGVDLQLPWESTLGATFYSTYLPVVNETTLNEVSGDNPSALDLAGPTRKGQAWGIELMLRRRMGQRLFGWATYSYGNAQRLYNAAGWRPADFDQTHVVNVVAAYALGRSWTVSGNFHLNSGRPSTPCWGYSRDGGSCVDPGTGEMVSARSLRNSDRLPTFWRVDVRIEKREAFDNWYLDFYVDWMNISMRGEVTKYDYEISPTGTYYKRANRSILTIPTFGLRATF